MKKNRKHNKPKSKQPKKRRKSIKKINTTNEVVQTYFKMLIIQ